MTKDSDSGINKGAVLAAITHPDPVKIPAAALPPPASYRPPSASRRVVAPPSRWDTHRSEICAIVASFVSIIWLTVGLALPAGGPVLVGVLFAVGSLAIWLLEVWNSD